MSWKRRQVCGWLAHLGVTGFFAVSTAKGEPIWNRLSNGKKCSQQP